MTVQCRFQLQHQTEQDVSDSAPDHCVLKLITVLCEKNNTEISTSEANACNTKDHQNQPVQLGRPQRGDPTGTIYLPDPEHKHFIHWHSPGAMLALLVWNGYKNIFLHCGIELPAKIYVQPSWIWLCKAIIAGFVKRKYFSGCVKIPNNDANENDYNLKYIVVKVY